MRIAIHDFAGHPFQFELSRELARRGHVVRHFFCADYPGPKGDSEAQPSDPENFSIARLEIKGGYSNEKMVDRLVGNLAYAKVAAKAIEAFRPDVVISGNTPTETQFWLMHASERVGAKFVYWMQDFYSIAVSTLLRDRWMGIGRLIGAVYRLFDRAQLLASEGIVLISEGFRPSVEKIVGESVPISVVPNWGTISEIDPGEKDNGWSREKGLHDRFVYLYSGTLGMKHNPDLLVALARRLETEDPQARVVVAAMGAGRTQLEKTLADAPQGNLILLGLQPMAEFTQMLAAADVFIAVLEPDAGQFSVPSKVLSYLCAARPVLISAPPENLSAMIVEGADAGAAVAAGNHETFVDAALTFLRDSDRRAVTGANGRRYAEDNFRIGTIADRFEAIANAARERR